MKTQILSIGVDGVVEDPRDRQDLEVKSLPRRFWNWLGSLSNVGQTLVWLAIGLPLTMMAVWLIANSLN